MNTPNSNHARPSGQSAAGSAQKQDSSANKNARRFLTKLRAEENRMTVGTQIEFVNQCLAEDLAAKAKQAGEVWQLENPAYLVNGRVKKVRLPPVILMEGPFRTLNDIFWRVVPISLPSSKDSLPDEFVLPEETSDIFPEPEDRLLSKFFSTVACLWEERPVSLCVFDRRLTLVEGTTLEALQTARARYGRGEAPLKPLAESTRRNREELQKRFRHASEMCDWKRVALEEFVNNGGDTNKSVPYFRRCDGSWITEGDTEWALQCIEDGKSRGGPRNPEVDAYLAEAIRRSGVPLQES